MGYQISWDKIKITSRPKCILYPLVGKVEVVHFIDLSYDVEAGLQIFSLFGA